MRNALKSVFVWAVVGGVCWGAYLWAGGALMDPFLGRVRSDVAGTLQVTSGESVTCTGGTIRGGARHLRVEGEGGAADNVDIITGGVAGDVLWLRPATAGHTLTLRNNVAGGGNILTPDAASYVMPDNGYVQLLCTGASWIAQDGVGTFGDVFGPSSSTDNQVVRFNGTTGKLLQASSMYVDDYANVSAYSLQASGCASLVLGGYNDAGTAIMYGFIQPLPTDTTAGSEDSDFLLYSYKDGAPVAHFAYNKGSYSDGPVIPSGTLHLGYPSSLADGKLVIYSEQGATDYLATINPNAAMTSNANFYLPADEPTAESWLTMGTDGVIDYTTIANETLSAVSARGETFAADAILPAGGKLRSAGTGMVYDMVFGRPTISSYYFGPSGNGTESGGYNVGVGGLGTLDSLTTGQHNVAVGDECLSGNTTGSRNVAIGNSNNNAYWNNDNVSIGYTSYYTLGAQDGCVGVGTSSGRSITGGSGYDTFIGYNAGYNGSQKSDATNSTGLGNGAYCEYDNQFTLGNADVTRVDLRNASASLYIGGVNALYSVNTEYFNAGAWVPNATNGPTAGTLESTTNLVMDDGYWFDPSTNQTAQITGRFPENWNCGPIRLQIESLSNCANESDVVWEFAGQVRRDGSTWDSAFGETVQIVDTHTGAGKVNVATSGYMSFAGTPQPGDVYKIRITRNAATAADTFNESMLATGLTLQFGESPIASHVWP